MLRKELIDKLVQKNKAVASGAMGPTYLRKIQTIKFRNFLENELVIFGSTLTAIVGRNGTGKSTVLHLAGCAFAPPPASGSTLTGKAGKTFNDFIPDSVKDNMPLDSAYGYEYGDGIKHSFVWFERGGARAGERTWDRRGTRSARRQRNTVFLGFEKNIPNVLSLSKYFELPLSDVEKRLGSMGLDADLVPLSDSIVSRIGQIAGKSYQTIQRRTDKYSELSENCFGYVVDGRYSDIASGSGEIAIIRMVDAISSAPGNSIILIDEPESGVHQIAQQNLLEFLVEQSVSRNHQIIYTTHSEYMLDGLSPASIILLRSYEGKVSPMAANKAVALKDIGHSLDKRFIAYVEDDFAADLLTNILEVDPATREIVYVEQSNSEGWQNMIKREFPRSYAIYRHAQTAPKPIFVLDGDASTKIDLTALTMRFGSYQKIRTFVRQNSLDELIRVLTRLSGAGSKNVINFRSLFKQYLAPGDEEELVRLIADYLEHFLDHLIFLPDTVPPEAVLFKWLQTALADSRSDMSRQLAILPNDKQVHFRSIFGASLPTDYTALKNAAKGRATILRDLKPDMYGQVICAWTTDKLNSTTIEQLIQTLGRVTENP